MTAANRGKVAEAELQKAIREFDLAHHDFDWGRVYDAYSAGGKFAAQTGDFVWYHRGRNGVIEVKEVAHDFRLPSKNFNGGQVARMRKRALAGAVATVIVRHSTTGLWRRVPLEFFIERLEETSWDLSSFPQYDSAAEAWNALIACD